MTFRVYFHQCEITIQFCLLIKVKVWCDFFSLELLLLFNWNLKFTSWSKHKSNKYNLIKGMWLMIAIPMNVNFCFFFYRENCAIFLNQKNEFLLYSILLWNYKNRMSILNYIESSDWYFWETLRNYPLTNLLKFPFVFPRYADLFLCVFHILLLSLLTFTVEYWDYATKFILTKKGNSFFSQFLKY